jgi:hypothetical protein
MNENDLTDAAPEPTEVEAVVQLLLGMPAWSDPVPDDGRDDHHRSIEEAVAGIAEYEPAAIAAGIAQFVERVAAGPTGYDVAAMSKPFVVTRAVLAAPDDVELDRPGFGGWIGVPIEAGRVDLLWPWSMVEGRLRLVGSFGGYMGESYLAIEEFASFEDRFGHRQATPIGPPSD